MILGRYLGPSFNVGSMYTAKILKQNGEVTHPSTYHALTETEWLSPNEIKARQEYDLAIKEALGNDSKPTDFNNLKGEFDTPEYKPYEDEDQGDLSMPEELPPTPEALDNYMAALLLLPHSC